MGKCTFAASTARKDLRLFLGGLLLALHGGLRFGDLQRIRLNSLSLTSHSLRGVCWQTKTTKRGQPFAVTLHGISGRALDSLWVLPFLRAVQSAWLATESAMGLSVVPDFILPVLTNLGGLARPTPPTRSLWPTAKVLQQCGISSLYPGKTQPSPYPSRLRKAVPSPCTASKFASSQPERKSAPQKKLANIKAITRAQEP